MLKTIYLLFCYSIHLLCTQYGVLFPFNGNFHSCSCDVDTLWFISKHNLFIHINYSDTSNVWIPLLKNQFTVDFFLLTHRFNTLTLWNENERKGHQAIWSLNQESSFQFCLNLFKLLTSWTLDLRQMWHQFRSFKVGQIYLVYKLQKLWKKVFLKAK